MKIALVSLNQKWEDKKSNMEHIRELFHVICNESIELIVFPEMTLTGFTMNVETMMEEYDTSPSIRFFQQCAIQFNTSIVFGVILKEREKAANALVMIDSNGEILARYNKIHPFTYAGEDVKYIQGNEIVNIEFNKVNIGFTICYDLRFPELFQALSKNADLIINIANWPEKRDQHWTCLLQARAIENQVFLAGVNRIGTDGNGISYSKSTNMIAPSGKIIEPIFTKEEIAVYDIDLKEVDTCRQNFPVKKDRQIDLYKRIL